MDWVLSQIRQWLVTPTHKFCAAIAMAFLAGRKLVDQRFCGWLGVYISLLVACRVFYHTADTRTGVNVLCRHQLGLTTYGQLCGCCLQQWSLSSVYEEQPLSWQQPEVFEDFHVTPLANNSIEYNLVPVLETFIGDKRWPAGTPISLNIWRLY